MVSPREESLRQGQRQMRTVPASLGKLGQQSRDFLRLPTADGATALDGPQVPSPQEWEPASSEPGGVIKSGLGGLAQLSPRKHSHLTQLRFCLQAKTAGSLQHSDTEQATQEDAQAQWPEAAKRAGAWPDNFLGPRGQTVFQRSWGQTQTLPPCLDPPLRARIRFSEATVSWRAASLTL